MSAIAATARAAVLGGATITAGHAQTAATPGAAFAGSNQKANLNCASGGAQVAGSNNVLMIAGRCKKLEIFGSNNSITITLAADAEVELVGSNNKVTWTTPDGTNPHVKELASGNMITKGG